MFRRLNIHLPESADGQGEGRQVEVLCPPEQQSALVLAHVVDRDLLKNQG